ncbi:unnamed protein product [Mycena citricolor]|uniref:Uncharacterized protein n=1 Tax=Mycena citricolor TaxID=2018698 RepID=A0AAD2K0X3_9AGAR|nr:unnamed protein product [Mycena citricolor]
MKALDGRGIGFDMDMFRAERTQSAGHCGDDPRAGPCAWTVARKALVLVELGPCRTKRDISHGAVETDLSFWCKCSSTWPSQGAPID